MTGALDSRSSAPCARQTQQRELVELWQSIVEKDQDCRFETGVFVEGARKMPTGHGSLGDESRPVERRTCCSLSVAGDAAPAGCPRRGATEGPLPAARAGASAGSTSRRGRWQQRGRERLVARRIGGCASVTISYRRDGVRALPRRGSSSIEGRGERRVRALMSVGGREHRSQRGVARRRRTAARFPNDAVIVQIGGTAAAELLRKFGISVTTKHGER